MKNRNEARQYVNIFPMTQSTQNSNSVVYGYLTNADIFAFVTKDVYHSFDEEEQ